MHGDEAQLRSSRCGGVIPGPFQSIHHHHASYKRRSSFPGFPWIKVGEFIRENNAAIVAQRVFGPYEPHGEPATFFEDTAGERDWPITLLEGQGRCGANFLTTQTIAISGISPTPLMLDGRNVGCVFEDADVQYCLLGNLSAKDTSWGNADQARYVLDNIESALQLAGLEFSDVVRTWFYLNDILGWYSQFNKVRTDFFTAHRTFDGLVPASTGIGSANALGSAIVANVLAMRPKNDKVRVREVASPLQCAAPAYGSSFSRAVEVVLPDHRQLYISGTASIEPSGKTAYQGDLENQVALSMRVVEAILKSRGMEWVDVTSGIAYFRNIEHKCLFDKYCKENDLPRLPVVAVAPYEICRDDLLFEIELDAVSCG